MFENIVNFFKKLKKTDKGIDSKSKETAKERLHLVLMQDRANVSADFLDMMKQEIIEVIKKYIDIDEKAIDVKLTNKMNDDGTVGAPALYANIPIVTIKNEARKIDKEEDTSSEDISSGDISSETITKDNNVEENVDTNDKKVEIKIEEPDSDKNSHSENTKNSEDSTEENSEEANENVDSSDKKEETSEIKADEEDKKNASK